MAEKKERKKRENLFQTNHPTIDPNDPAVLITAGLVPPETAVEPAQEPQEEIKAVTPAEPEKPVEEPTGANTNGLEDLLSHVKAAKKKKAKSKTRSLYLSDPVYNELVKRSKKEGMSASEYLEALLKGAFGL